MGSFWFGSRECRVKRKGALVTRIEVTFFNGTHCKGCEVHQTHE